MSTDELSWPGVYALHVIRMAARFGASAEALLVDLDLDLDVLSDPETRVTRSELTTIVQRAVTLSREPALGIWLGLEMSVTWHGFLGFAAMSSATLADALLLIERFVAIRWSGISVSHRLEAGRASVVFDEQVPLGPLREVILSALLLGLARMASSLVDRAIEATIDVTFERPAYFERVEAHVPFHVRFAQPFNRIVVPMDVLALPITSFDPVALRQATSVCERELASLCDPGRTLSRLRGVLPKDSGGFHSAEEVAARLHVSPRTLRRQLAMAGTTFSSLVDDARRELALVLIQNRDLSLESIAEAVGYSDVPNFTRAFRRWTGVTPGAYRRM